MATIKVTLTKEGKIKVDGGKGFSSEFTPINAARLARDLRKRVKEKMRMIQAELDA